MSDKPAYRFSGKTSSIDPKKIGCEQGRFVCHTHAKFSYSSITDNRKSRYTKIYAGSSSGAFVSHPGAFDHCDKDYDPRARPWYIAGATGGKNVLLLFNI